MDNLNTETRGRGRPQFEITHEVIGKVESLAETGLNLREIALVLGISYETLNEKKKEFSDFSDAIDIGRAKGVNAIKNKFFEKAKEGDNHCMTMYLKNYSDLKDKRELDIPGGIHITITETDAELG